MSHENQTILTSAGYGFRYVGNNIIVKVFTFSGTFQNKCTLGNVSVKIL